MTKDERSPSPAPPPEGSRAERKRGASLPALAGVPISIKDNFDEAGVITRAGSTVLANAPAASRDASVVERLRAAGAIIIGRTNMT